MAERPKLSSKITKIFGILHPFLLDSSPLSASAPNLGSRLFFGGESGGFRRKAERWIRGEKGALNQREPEAGTVGRLRFSFTQSAIILFFFKMMDDCSDHSLRKVSASVTSRFVSESKAKSMGLGGTRMPRGAWVISRARNKPSLFCCSRSGSSAS